MTERGVKTLIGGFVLGALALLLTSLTLVGSGMLFDKNVSFVLFFDTSLRGLVPGSPVYFRGVRVGKVQSLHIDVDARGDGGFVTPVVIQVDSALITGARRAMDNSDQNLMSNERLVEELIREGLRAQLGMQSFITGQLTVEMDIMENPAPFSPDPLPRVNGLQQIPTQPSSLDTVLRAFRRVPVEEVLMDLMRTGKALSAQLTGMDLPALTASVTGLSEDIRAQVAALPGLRQSMEQALASFTSLTKGADAGLDVTMKEVRDALRQVRDTLRQASVTLNGIQSLTASSRNAVNSASRLMAEDSVPMVELGQALRALRDAARAVDNLATLLELKPDALIFGKER